ncbi:hypothetical protein ACIHCV_32460 [Streptomyces sp. NPDC051956]|uniref:hypothetical protein n=1 Tax=Streptomyces sp. NPDC051956 TaxID=3365677 RepID=UPI0037CD1928
MQLGSSAAPASLAPPPSWRAFALFVLVERRAAEPVMPLTVFAHRNFSLAGALSLVVGFAVFGGVTLLSQFQQEIDRALLGRGERAVRPARVTAHSGGTVFTKQGRLRPVGTLRNVNFRPGWAR